MMKNGRTNETSEMEGIFLYTPKENLLRTLRGDHPDALVNEYSPFVPVMNDPVMRFVRGNRVKGTSGKDVFGTTIVWPENQFAAMPHVTQENKVLPDITEWRRYVKVPDLRAAATDWSDALQAKAQIDRDRYFVMGFMGTGMFEQLHFLMGFEDTLMNLLAEPEAMEELLDVICEYRLTYAKLLCENLKPDVILSHDDWGAKDRMFMSPQVWREYFKPRYQKLYGYMKSQGVMVIHHADSFLEPIVEDMAEIGVDIWQGVLPQNDIPGILKRLDGRMTLMGGIDAAIVDQQDVTEETIRAETRRACMTYGPLGHYIPCLTYGLSGSIYPQVDAIIKDEIDKCSRELFG